MRRGKLSSHRRGGLVEICIKSSNAHKFSQGRHNVIPNHFRLRNPPFNNLPFNQFDFIYRLTSHIF
ncbi:hypothetical protein BMS3Bbin01_02842 [bacterium BMS3Bbin01]|nr:hypothetical protein BMS3Bbin01_02842 [bacterium BMS3Bbin01]